MKSKKRKVKQPDVVIPEEAYRHARAGSSVHQIAHAYGLPIEVAEKVIVEASQHADSHHHKVNLQAKIREQIPTALAILNAVMMNKDGIVSNDLSVAAVRLKAADIILKTAAKFIETKEQQELPEQLQPTLFDSVADETGAIELKVVPLRLVE